MLYAFKAHVTATLNGEKGAATPFPTGCAMTGADTVALCAGRNTDGTAETGATMLEYGVHVSLL